MTVNGNTIAARNMDWNVLPSGISVKQILTVRKIEKGSGKYGTAILSFPGQVGCITGMNAEGLTAATHDAMGHPASAGIHPYDHMLIFREILESISAQTAVQDISNLLSNRSVIMPQNLVVGLPASVANIGSVVFEMDGALEMNQGFTLREPASSDLYQVCTNHFRIS